MGYFYGNKSQLELGASDWLNIHVYVFFAHGSFCIRCVLNGWVRTVYFASETRKLSGFVSPTRHDRMLVGFYADGFS